MDVNGDTTAGSPTGEDNPDAAEATEINEPDTSEKIPVIKKLFHIPEVPRDNLKIIAIVGLSVLIVITLGVFYYFYSMKQSEFRPRDAFAITAPAYRINNSHFIYPSVSFTLDGKAYAIKMINIDTLATVFYLDSELNAPGREIILYDGDGNSYEPDYARVSTNTAELPFLPFTKPVKYFTLEISGVRIPFRIDGGFNATPVGYSEAAAKITHGGSSFAVGPGVFSSAMSTFNYISRVSPGEGFYFDGGFGGDAVLIDGIKRMLPVKHLQYLFDDGVTIGKYVFPPVLSLSSAVGLELSGLSENHSPKIEMEINTYERNMELNVGNKKIILEGIMRQGKYYVLVLHGVDKTVSNDKRIETSIAARLEISKSDPEGETERFIINGLCHSGPIGSDVLFEISDIEDKIKDGALEYALFIDEVYFLIDSVVTSIPITAAEKIPDGHGEAVETVLGMYGEKAQLAAYAHDDNRFYAIVLERENGMVKTYKEILTLTADGWAR